MSLQHDRPKTAQASVMAGELRVLLSRIIRRLREQSNPGDFTWSQKSVIFHLEREGPATVTTLARAEGVRPQSMGATVSDLQQAGLISGSPDPNDGRRTLLSLTPACLERIQASRAAKEDWLFHAIQTKLNEDEQDQLATSLKLLARIVEP